MLFDLRGKRKRAIQVTYAALALLMGGGLVLFGIGSSANGGLLDAVGLGGGNSNSSRGNNYDKEATRLEAQLKRHPRDRAVLVKLVRARILAGNTKSPSNSATGQVTYSQDSVTEFQLATDAWERYLKTRPPKPDTSIALLVANSYVAVAQNEQTLGLAIAGIRGAAKAQKVYADAKPSLGSLSQLALYDYLAGNLAGGDTARDASLKLAPKANRSTLKTRLEQARKQGIKLAKQVKTQAKLQGGKEQLQNPLGGLSGGGLGSGSTSTPPAP
jgi:hypothetical protein